MQPAVCIVEGRLRLIEFRLQPVRPLAMLVLECGRPQVVLFDAREYPLHLGTTRRTGLEHLLLGGDAPCIGILPNRRCAEFVTGGLETNFSLLQRLSGLAEL